MNHQEGMTLERFQHEYDGHPSWDTGKPQHYFVEALTQRTPQSPVLDIGCGTGVLSKFVADLGCGVLGIDFAPKAIEIASEKYADCLPDLAFKVHDAFALDELGMTFGTILDCCFFHTLDDPSREQYTQMLHHVLAPGGRVYLLNLAVALPSPTAPRAITEADITEHFDNGWTIVELGSTRVDITFAPDGVLGTFACIEKTP
ncbi:putative protein [BD1-7 clade bacterium]|uniref:Methyltransferase domain-containing protein n=1 Tax=BD1-7 clade bacterium TaxID=2029982 RepID=A0A5S9PH68_9GAMM|nr:putative protein [BD1-7 clade bacterium]CAA0103540.1 putative protein [BD1-7 clade bacterium]